ncbi:disease resistance protein TAO1-like [Neltuma alba]|uniref:disease resistance protein TAO1-like n=1 Tax=Neltuma alba TaxID=207710 RepID=UPI0010A4F9C5|nr:disease resistance protein TAO1-like [Prosopis alba]
MDDVIQKLDACGCHARIGIEVLEDRGLVTIDNNKLLRMHNLLQLTGKQIICQTSRNELGNRGLYVMLAFMFSKIMLSFPKGKYLKAELLQAIGSSKISIVIFSGEYVGSKWCLEELSMITELHESNNNQVILPVFYHVDPSEIHHQSSHFGIVFKDLIKGNSSPSKDRVSEWGKPLLRLEAL